ncbi:MAG: Lrp/AsnC family transcriptional regulator, partial [Bacteroidales bacterium]|nr:Lrp/AsnC family transcriptional regulator [Bacteroidales bacterium]
MQHYQIDETDRKILSFLVNNARMPFLEIARECGISGAAVHQRVKKMEQNKVISGSRLVVKPAALGLNVCAFISVCLSEDNKYPEVVEALKLVPEIVECH